MYNVYVCCRVGLRISSFRAHHSQLKKPADVCRSVLACRRLRQYNTFVKERDRLYTHRTEHTRTHSSKLSVFSVCLCVADLSVRLCRNRSSLRSNNIRRNDLVCARVCVSCLGARMLTFTAMREMRRRRRLSDADDA